MQIFYEIRYRHIYMKVCEFVSSTDKIEVQKDFIVPIIKKVIKNYARFRTQITEEQERIVCDEYIRSMKRILYMLEKRIKLYEENLDCEIY